MGCCATDVVGRVQPISVSHSSLLPLYAFSISSSSFPPPSLASRSFSFLHLLILQIHIIISENRVAILCTYFLLVKFYLLFYGSSRFLVSGFAQAYQRLGFEDVKLFQARCGEWHACQCCQVTGAYC
jgi:hypothetical protein